jgi:hypothetical protein
VGIAFSQSAEFFRNAFGASFKRDFAFSSAVNLYFFLKQKDSAHIKEWGVKNLTFINEWSISEQ